MSSNELIGLCYLFAILIERCEAVIDATSWTWPQAVPAKFYPGIALLLGSISLGRNPGIGHAAQWPIDRLLAQRGKPNSSCDDR
jgi:hypothetical protein